MNYEFASDNTAPAAVEIVAAIAAANSGYVLSYGADPWTEQLRENVANAFEATSEIGVVPILSGKLANHLSLAAITEPGGIVFSHEHAHILIDENDGPAYVTRCRMVGLPGEVDKIDPAALRTAIAREQPLPRGSALSITTATEAGGVYSLAQMNELATIAHDAGMPVHLDGARLANAAVALGCELADISWRVGIDILSLGATKNGGLGAEAVVAFGPETAAKLKAKQLLLGHEASKMRFLSAQLIAWLENDGWRSRAAHANSCATQLALRLRSIPGIDLVQPVEANLIFAAISPEVEHRLEEANYFVYPMPMFGENVVRFAVSWATTDESIRALVHALRS
jgi:threonine aldolase